MTLYVDFPSHRRTAFTRVELAAILAICFLIAAPLFISASSRAKARSQRIDCARNLQALGLVFKTWALDHGDQFPMSFRNKLTPAPPAFEFFQVLSNEIAKPNILICPADVRRPAQNLSDGFSNLNLSYFVGLDATDSNPQMFLFGDRNLSDGPLPATRILILNTNYPLGWTREMHFPQGNIGLADGSVQQFSTARLKKASVNGGRLAMP
ncbi:MAG TPA: hypothetical protein VFE51_04870 [Verrucomicrobiae bacterium]|nr:hypothetical protein [Verrucomicrobiae bacterium]